MNRNLYPIKGFLVTLIISKTNKQLSKNMMNIKLKLLAGCSALLGGALAKITDDSHLWAKPWYSDEFNLGVNSKGEVYSTDDTMERFIKAPLTLEGKVKNHL